MAQITLNSNGVASNGSLVLQSNGTTTAVTIDSTQRAAFVAGTAAAPAITTSGDTDTGIFFPAANTLAFSTGGTEDARFDSSGNLGLGVTPSAWGSGRRAFQVSGSAANYFMGANANATVFGTNFFYDDGIGNNKYVSTGFASMLLQSSGQFQFYTAGSGTAGNAITFTQAMTLDASGNLGIGTTSPSVRLDVQNGNATINRASNSTILTLGGSPSANWEGDIQFLTSNTQTNWRVSSNRNVSGAFTITPSTAGGGSTFTTPALTIDSSGNLLVGTTNYSDGRINAVTASGVWAIGVKDVFGNSALIKFVNSSGTQVGSITSTGGTSTQYNTTSDYRLKENIEPMAGALAKVSALKPVTYTWKLDGSPSEGFIAHELAEVCPQAVTGEKDAVETYTDEEGNEQTRPKYQGIDTSFLVATLTAAIQELKAIVDAQAAEIAALKG